MHKKLCQRCNQYLGLENFYKQRKNKDLTVNYCIICTNQQARERQRKIKMQCIAYKGGKCSLCKYNKCLSALEFHHLDPNQKDFNISKIKKTRMDEEVIQELDKCVLLCSNCHREAHEKLIKIPIDISFKSNIIVAYKYKNINFCKNPKRRKVSIWNCKLRPNTRKVERPPYDQLLKEIKETNYTRVGKKYGVSSAAIKKWTKMYEKYGTPDKS